MVHNLDEPGNLPTNSCSAEQLATITECQARPEAGDILDGKYRIESLIGSGGMGAVYIGEQIFLKKRVAIKIVTGKAARDRWRLERLCQEAQTASQLKHPSIVDIRDFGITEAGMPYLIMEYIEGQPLSNLVASGVLSFTAKLEILISVCDAVAHAHRNGVVHRDLKPANIMVSLQNSGSKVSVVDFGLAKFSDAEGHDQRQTATGEVFGSPAYMSPEQVQGHPARPASDIYALGCILFETFSGRKAFDGANALEIMHKQLKEAPPTLPPDSVPPAMYNQLAGIIAKAMSKDAESRPASADELVAALQQCHQAAIQ
jgi:serine/threonine-protein kinase